MSSLSLDLDSVRFAYDSSRFAYDCCVPPVRAVLLTTLASSLLWPTIGRAETPASFGLDLAWTAGPGCPGQASAEAAILEILGPHVVTGGPSNVVRVNISALDTGGSEARILTQGPSGSGERRFEGPTCNLVADAAVLVVAMMLDPMAIAERIKSMTEASQRAASSPTPPPGRDHPRILAGLRATADVGSLPGPAGGLGVVLGVQYGRWHLEGLMRTAWLPAPGARPTRTGPGRRDWSLQRGPPWMLGCGTVRVGGAAAGWLSGWRGRGDDRARHHRDHAARAD